MAIIEQIRIVEAVKVDPDRMVELCVNLGDVPAEHLVMQSIDELASCMSELEEGLVSGRTQYAVDRARHMIGLAEHIGMVTLSRTLDDLLTCIEQDDRIGLTAVASRLQRITDKSLGAVWEMRDNHA